MRILPLGLRRTYHRLNVLYCTDSISSQASDRSPFHGECRVTARLPTLMKARKNSTPMAMKATSHGISKARANNRVRSETGDEGSSAPVAIAPRNPKNAVPAIANVRRLRPYSRIVSPEATSRLPCGCRDRRMNHSINGVRPMPRAIAIAASVPGRTRPPVGVRGSQTFYKPRHFDGRSSRNGEPMTHDAPRPRGGRRSPRWPNQCTFASRCQGSGRQNLSIDRAGERERQGPQGDERGHEARRARRGAVRRDGGGRPARGDPRAHAAPLRGEGRALRVRAEQAGARRRRRPGQGDRLDRDPRPGEGEARRRRPGIDAPRDEEVTVVDGRGREHG